MNIYTPYTYLIGWSCLNTYYYGVRYALKADCLYETGCHPDEFWVTYFTSSVYVEQFRQLHGEPDIIQVRKTFEDAVSAKKWEHNVLVRMNCLTESKWLNKHDASDKFFRVGPHLEETCNKISETRLIRKIEPWNKGKTGVYSEETLNKFKKPKPAEHVENIKKNHVGTTGYSHTDETKQKMKGRVPWNKGVSHSDETKQKISQKKLGRNDAGMNGRIHSEEAKEKQSLARKLWWERKKQNEFSV